MDSCTLFHLRNQLQRRAVTKKIKTDPTSCEDFFLLVTTGHLLYAVMSAIGMSSLEDSPSDICYSNFAKKSEEERKSILENSIQKVLDTYLNIETVTLPPDEEGDSEELSENEGDTECVQPKNDSVLEYAKEIFSLGLLLMEFIDSIKEGDGERILRCWKYMLLYFKVSHKVKYSIEAFHLLAHYHYIYSERLCRQLLCSRTINVHGKPGKNISMDLHLEHLNRDFKTVISNLGSNTLGPSLQRTGKALKVLKEIQVHYDNITCVRTESECHSSRNTKKDLLTVIEQLQKAEVFKFVEERKHQQFSMTGSLLNKVDTRELKNWMKSQLKSILRYNV